MNEKKDDRFPIDTLREIVLNLPESPGIYQYLDKEQHIIYVGKAKNLKKRVYSYFSKEHESGKTRVLVSKIRDIKYIVVNSEEDALLLENNLIKEHKPRYNVLLKDDKTYPSICVTNEHFPRVFKTRQITKNGALYFGPYSHVPSMMALLELIRNLYPIRTCRLPLTPENIAKGKFSVCLEYHIKKCKAPCVGKQTEEEYSRNIAEVKEILRGNTQTLLRSLQTEMKSLAMELKFEEAQQAKEKYLLIENFRSRSEVVSSIRHEVDVFGIETDEQVAYINYLHITDGCITQAFTFEYKKRLEESREELLQWGIVEMRERYKSKAKEIIVPFHIDVELEGITFTVPQKGDKKLLLSLSQLNVKQYKADRLKQSEKLNPEQRSIRTLKELQNLLHLEETPFHIECFDNSNIQGSHAVAACVVFKQGKPSKKDYRHFNIQTVEGPDDYASMREIIYRRYAPIVAEGGDLPHLLLVDGGKGQMEVARQVIEDELHTNIPIVGLAKDKKHKTSEILFGFPPVAVGIKQGTTTFHLLEQIQNEVHRFAISFHRDKRSKSSLQSELDNIEGIGMKRKTALLQTFKSVKRIKEATEEALTAVVGKQVAKAIRKYFDKEK
ncbi:MAG: excinuclease ABC subunit UvrC [Phocaeicola sp.]|nr:excinuclease ABC subunit UvrC [Phocaeicola sp.]